MISLAFPSIQSGEVMKVLSFARPALRASLALAALVGAACPSPFGADKELRPAIIEFTDSEPVRVVVPATAAAGTPFEVRVISYGGGCITRGPTEVSVSGSTALVEPFQTGPADDDVVCTQELRIFENTASVAFAAPGAAKVVVRGYSSISRRIITVERTVQVQ
jgi:hypothetical protein